MEQKVRDQFDGINGDPPLNRVHDVDMRRLSVSSMEPLPFNLDDLLGMLAARNGSDLHLTAGLPPMGRVDGNLVPLSDVVLDGLHSRALVYEALSDLQISYYEQRHELDGSYSIKHLGRFRFNVYRQRDNVGAAFRAIANRIPSLEELRVPGIVGEMALKTSGLVLVTGMTGAGKSSTLAALVDLINNSRSCHIMTLEDPIEFLHTHKHSMVNQRELGTDTDSFAAALRSVLREDPDVILVGELRDLKSISAAITLAETGHLVLATLHTRSATQAVDRLVDVFPPHQQHQIRYQLSNSLEMIVAQQLVPKVNGGRVLAAEILCATSAVRSMIRDGKTHQLLTAIETSASTGMVSTDRALARLCKAGIISLENALLRCADPDNFNQLLRSP